MGKRQKISEIVVKVGDKLTINNINNRSISGEVNAIKEDGYQAIMFESVSDSNFKVHHVEINATQGPSCPSIISEVLTFSEAAEIWGIDPSTLRHKVTGEKLIEGVDYRKSGKVWLITMNAMEKLYGVKIGDTK
ncbi:MULTISPECIES: helix-turn-helix domain-containing protein [Pseudobacteroides]|uniref:Helix-turn-helix domain-containing protein n=1 Tax=Pseudobacteroides cellulosolvens ATCC 35603 = DSM 2933 TaxID=398512 RepID=A0A0L6JTJ0_9FIRM|nr:helix-turn-helix domain-containing protein [Pseudobacteroides cellulosolvens]KNY29000.1 hypothetical protein Bccel_4274 [Pseudobacteroides cellulosolvens ATCC 35603 = DSM 2933]